MSPFPCYVAGRPVLQGELPVRDPYRGDVVAVTSWIGPDELEQALSRTAIVELDRYRRHEILMTAERLLGERIDEFSQLITRESGLCVHDTRQEVARARDVLRFSAIAALDDDGQVFSCDVTPNGKARKIFTLREPVPLVAAITPFNHPLNQVVHKLGPAIAAGSATILKPSEKTPLTAIRFGELLFEAGLPEPMLSVLLGPVDTVVEPLVRDPRVGLASFTGSVAIGRRVASIAGYKKLCLELGGNSPLIVLDDADLELAVKLAAEGCFKNSGQRCTAVKRLLVQDGIHEEFVAGFLARAREWVCGDPMDTATRIGTVIDVAAAMALHDRAREAVADGARIVLGGGRDDALLEPTVLVDVPRETRLVNEEAFGPLAPIVAVRDLDDAIRVANSTDYGLSTGIVTRDLDAAMRAVREIRTGTVNVNEVPGYRIERSPFGGVKSSGLGIKEGVVEAIKTMTNVKTFSLPW